jgi:hypothetical protein
MSNKSNDSDNNSVQEAGSLFLGMAITDYDKIISKKIYRRKGNRIYGQAKRDHIRLKKFANIFSIKCYTIDNKHDDILNKHVYANFNDPRRLDKKIDNIFLDHPIFKWIFLDYFFSPVLKLLLFIIILNFILFIYL